MPPIAFSQTEYVDESNILRTQIEKIMMAVDYKSALFNINHKERNLDSKNKKSKKMLKSLAKDKLSLSYYNIDYINSIETQEILEDCECWVEKNAIVPNIMEGTYGIIFDNDTFINKNYENYLKHIKSKLNKKYKVNGCVENLLKNLILVSIVTSFW